MEEQFEKIGKCVRSCENKNQLFSSLNMVFNFIESYNPLILSKQYFLHTDLSARLLKLYNVTEKQLKA